MSRFAIFLLIGGLLLVLALWGVYKNVPAPTKKADGQHSTGSANPSTGSKPAPGAASAPAQSAAAQKVDPAAVAEVRQTIEQALAVLRDPAVADKTQAIAALKEALAKAEPAAAIAAIRQFIASGQDVPTGQRFKVGEGGVLDEAPTLRTLLMDQLGSLSTGLGATDAAEVAREVLSAKNSPDEWAVALRNLAWSDPDGSKATLAAKARELLNYAPWRNSPSGGYLEAFDTIPYSGDPTLMADLAPLSKPGSTVQQAALVALDRLSAMAPAEVVAYLNANPDVLADRPMFRADYMGKVDLSDPTQLSAAETYLQRQDVTQAEKDKFLARLGMPAGFASNNLLTPGEIVTMPLLERRELVNQTATTWLNSGKFPASQNALQTLIANTKDSPAP